MKETTPASTFAPLALPIAQVFDLGSRMVRVSLGDLTNEAALRRPHPEGSSISFLTGHLIAGRHTALDMIGEPSLEAERWRQQFGGGLSATDGEGYPPIEELLVAWNELTPTFRKALGTLSEDRLLTPIPQHPFPTTEDTLRGVLTFLAFHEAYHVGQIGFLRTFLGYPPVQERLSETTRAGGAPKGD